MRATLSFSDKLIEDLIRETGAKYKTQAITQAIEDFLSRRRLDKLLSLQGKLDLEDNWKEIETLEIEALKRRTN